MESTNGSIADKETSAMSSIDPAVFYENCKIISQEYAKLSYLFLKMSEGKQLQESDTLHHLQVTSSNKKKIKDPNAPKKPLTAFLLFCNDKREILKGLYPGFSAQEVTKKLGDMWKSVSNDEKVLYEEKAKEKRENYSMLMQEYVNTHGAGENGAVSPSPLKKPAPPTPSAAASTPSKSFSTVKQADAGKTPTSATKKRKISDKPVLPEKQAPEEVSSKPAEESQTAKKPKMVKRKIAAATDNAPDADKSSEKTQIISSESSKSISSPNSKKKTKKILNEATKSELEDPLKKIEISSPAETAASVSVDLVDTSTAPATSTASAATVKKKKKKATKTDTASAAFASMAVPISLSQPELVSSLKEAVAPKLISSSQQPPATPIITQTLNSEKKKKKNKE